MDLLDVFNDHLQVDFLTKRSEEVKGFFVDLEEKDFLFVTFAQIHVVSECRELWHQSRVVLFALYYLVYVGNVEDYVVREEDLFGCDSVCAGH